MLQLSQGITKCVSPTDTPMMHSDIQALSYAVYSIMIIIIIIIIIRITSMIIDRETGNLGGTDRYRDRKTHRQV